MSWKLAHDRFAIHDRGLNTYIAGDTDGALRALIRETYAIAALKEISQGEAFASSVAYAAKQPFEFAGKMITDPVDTVTALPKGVFGIFENVGTSISMEHDPSEDSRLEQALFVSSWKRAAGARGHGNRGDGERRRADRVSRLNRCRKVADS